MGVFQLRSRLIDDCSSCIGSVITIRDKRTRQKRAGDDRRKPVILHIDEAIQKAIDTAPTARLRSMRPPFPRNAPHRRFRARCQVGHEHLAVTD